MNNAKETKTTVQDIIEIIDSNYNQYKGSNEAVLHAAEEIIDLFESKKSVESEETKLPSAEEYIRRLYPLSDKFSRLGVERIAESYAKLSIEHHRKEWEKERVQLLENIMENFKGVHSDYHAEIVETVIQDLKHGN